MHHLAAAARINDVAGCLCFTISTPSAMTVAGCIRWKHEVMRCDIDFTPPAIKWMLGWPIPVPREQAADKECACLQDEDTDLSLKGLLQDNLPRAIATIVLLVASTVGMLPFLYIETCTLVEYGPWLWLNAWNVMDVLAYVFQEGSPSSMRACMQPLAVEELHRRKPEME